MQKILVLGAGRVGKAIIYDLSQRFEVTAADLNEDALHIVGSRYKVATELLNNGQLPHFSPFDLVISAVPGFLGFETAKKIIESGKPLVDISFFPEDALQLDELAKEKGVQAFVDCGVAPGLDNIILGHYDQKMKIDSFTCYVGGLPKHPEEPWQYKAPFSPVDVIEEYVRPARYVENGEIKTVEPLTDLELLDFDEVGKLEAFLTDGLRSILYTMPHIQNMKEKTLRYPGKALKIELLKQTGMLSETPVEIDGELHIPRKVMERLLLPQWELLPDEEEFTIMRIVMEGEGKKITYTIYDEYDRESGLSSMARTTGFTCAAVVNYILQNSFEPGLYAPEILGQKEGVYDFVMSYLRKRGVKVRSIIDQ